MSLEFDFENAPGARERARYGIRRNITWLAGASLAVKPIWLVFLVVLCWRYLGTGGYGIFTTALWLSHIPTSFTDLGLGTHTTREVARSRELAPTYFSNLLALKIGMAPVALLATVAVAFGLGYSRVEMLSAGWAAVYAIGLSLTAYVRAFYQAFEDLRLEGISVIAEKVVVVALGTGALILFSSPHATLCAMAIGMVLTTAMNVAWISRNLASLQLRLLQWSFMVSTVKSALPLGLYAFLAVVHFRAGGVLLERWHGETVAGLFGAPFRILEALFLILVVFMAALLPRLSDLYHKRDGAQFKSVFIRNSAVGIGITVCCSALVWLLSDLLIAIVNPDPSAAQAAGILRYLIWLLPLITTRELIVGALIASDQQKFLARSLAVCTVISLGLNFVFTRPLGVPGVLTTFVLTEILIIGLCSLKYSKVMTAIAAVAGPRTPIVG